MNLYREVTIAEVKELISLEMPNHILQNESSRTAIGHAIQTMTKREALQVMKQNTKPWVTIQDCQKLRSKLKKLYFALNEIYAGRKIYTDLLREDD
ncbi:hypothetical protein [Bacillus phage vB_BtM_BMBsp2]|nr:hypothetical protein [Bacillus phage vB_BtM_BMBsp2]